MIRIEQLPPAANFNPQPILIINRWVVNTDVVFSVIAPQGRARVSVPVKSVAFKKIRPRRMRAEFVRIVLGGYRKTGALRISRAQVDEAFLQVLKADGCDPVFRAYQAAKLRILGSLRHGVYWYWRVPKPISTTSGVPQPEKPQDVKENSQD